MFPGRRGGPRLELRVLSDLDAAISNGHTSGGEEGCITFVPIVPFADLEVVLPVADYVVVELGEPRACREPGAGYVAERVEVEPVDDSDEDVLHGGPEDGEDDGPGADRDGEWEVGLD